MLARRLFAKRTDFLYERYSLFNFTGVVVARMFGKPIVLEVNSPLALEQQRDKHIRAAGFAKWTEKVVCNLATKVIVVSTPLKDMMIEMGVKPEKLVVMTNGVRTELFKAGDASADLKASLRLQNRTIIGFVGWFRKWHGLEMLVDAFHEARLAEKNAALLLIGDGPAMEDLRAAVQRYGIKDAVIFSGPLPHDKVPRYLDLVDIAVQPAANEYCCPMKILEYMALGKAIVAPRQDNILDVLKDDEAVFFEPNQAGELGKAMARLTADPGLRTRLGRACRRALDDRSYSWISNARRVVEAVGPSL
jgi:glycosyltransferase involved in cell wall biosynthesis